MLNNLIGRDFICFTTYVEHRLILINNSRDYVDHDSGSLDEL